MATKKSKFKMPSPGSSIPTDPEALFRDLKKRSADIQHLWSHQADILREYHSKHFKSKDLAIELPTGAGKTLVGLLIGEFRRRTRQERVLYLCPTRQLAYQVGNQAKARYGIKVSVLVGPQTKYEETAYADYVQGDAVGVTTYSAVFNTNPKLDDANLLILDDAHAAENYISGLWTLDIEREDHAETYFGLLDIVASVLPASLVAKLRAERGDPLGILVDKVPLPFAWKRIPQVTSFLDDKTSGGNLRYPWSMLRDHLWACNLFVSWHRFSLRPLVPPSLTHAPFERASQRVYMSATLGEGGELERIMGVPKIARLPVPAGWDKQSTGRRFIVFANHSLGERAATAAAIEAMKGVSRTLVLCPSTVVAERFVRSTRAELEEFKFLHAADIEESLESFTKRSKAVLVLTARYDGIDLPGDACRLEIVAGLPGSTNLQEQFFLSRLGAHSLLRDRIRTRIGQAVGRCTRHATDYAAVILLGSDLLKDCSRKEFRSGLHPELQAEFEFGLDNSAVNNRQEFIELLNEFLDHGEGWAEAEQAIQGLRESKVKVSDPVSDVLMSVVSREVELVYALFKGNMEGAFQLARQIVDQLSGGSELKPYRAWWYYIAGSLAWWRAENGEQSLRPVARDLFKRADAASISVSWFSRLAESGLLAREDASEDHLVGHAVEGIYKYLSSLGFIGPKFEPALESLGKRIESKNHEDFSKGLKQLGDCLGFEADFLDGTATPDVTWSIAGHLLLFEVKVEESPQDSISVSTCRQTSGHRKWAKANRQGFEQTRAIVVSPRKTLARDAVPHAEDVHYVHVDDIQRLTKIAISFLRESRTDCEPLMEETAKETIALKLASSPELHPRKVIAATEFPAAKLPIA